MKTTPQNIFILENNDITNLYSYQLLIRIAPLKEARVVINKCRERYAFTNTYRSRSDQLLSNACRKILKSYSTSFVHYVKINYHLKKHGFSGTITAIDHSRLFNLHRNEVPRLTIQSGEISKFYNYLLVYINSDRDYIINVFENTCILLHDLSRCENITHLLLAIAQYTKSFTQQSLVVSLLNSQLMTKFCALFNNGIDFDVDSLITQSGEFNFDTLKDYLANYEKAKTTPFYKKMYKFTMYALSLSLFERFGLTLDNSDFSILEKEAIKRKYHIGPDFLHCLIDTIVFLCERGQQCLKLGSMEPLYHSKRSYEAWLETCRRLVRESNFLSNPEPHNIDRFVFIAELKDAIEKGTCIVKYADIADPIEKKIVRSVLDNLKMIEGTELTKRAAQKDREAPFPILLHGCSSIGKSTLTKILFYQYGKIFGLDTNPEFKYTRNPADKFWSNFNSTQWCVQMDDIAFMNPNIAVGGDPSVMEMLQVINNVPFVPTQADIVDKGRTPLLSKFVIATTNTIHMNAQAYFACPLAVQRRMPFVITAIPKPEYRKDGHFLDSSKVPVNEPGEYPDYWHFKVEKVVPADKSHLAKLELLHKFTDMNTFIRWFSKTALAYAVDQKQVLQSDKNMQSIVLCKECFVPVSGCKCDDNVECQAGEVYLGQNFNEVSYMNSLTFYWLIFLTYVYSYRFVRYSATILGVNEMYENSIISLGINSSIWGTLIARMGRNVQRKIGTNIRMANLAKILTVGCGVILILKKLYKFLNVKSFKGQTTENIDIPATTGKPPVPDASERFNPWYKDDYTTTSFDVNPVISSYKGLEYSVIKNKILNNCCHLDITYTRENEERHTPTKAFCLGGNKYILNNHALRTDVELFRISVNFTNDKLGVNPNPVVYIKQSEIIRIVDKDLCCITLYGVPPKKDLSKLFAEPSFKGKFVGEYLSKDKYGSTSVKKVDNVHLSTLTLPPLASNLPVWQATIASELSTIFGDCGSVLLTMSPSGPVILGLHVAGKDGVVVAIQVTSDDISRFNLLDRDLFGNGQPALSSGEIKRELTSIHNKSVVKYTEQGCANVYGSFMGYRPKHKSSVTLTDICEDMVLDRYSIKHGPPVMNGWEPWRIAFVEMVEPINLLCASDVDKCVDAFYTEICNELPASEIEKIHVLDDYTTINGAAGVTYIDKINRSTSMGNPWKCTKKKYLTPDLVKWGIQDPVKFDPEIMLRVDDIINKYHNKERAFPNFCAHLKDEATSYAKIESKKTRVFTGAPVDWSIVVRKYLLSVVRVIQRNRFTFESAPGTIPQSAEWGDIYKYLTKFGKDTMVAGDYSKFDKRMPPSAILGAFRIIEQLCEKAGYSNKDLLVIRGIAYDTAYPLVDFNGDLIEFYGSNPSGHPLTVIINSLVNCIYVRYSYIQLNPAHECMSFKHNVSLMTYGDDNAMGVSALAPWFNHTSIASTLKSVGIKYTMADKEAESIPYISIHQVSFLKRIWVWNDEVGNYLCPLEEDSINKMLTVCVKSKTISSTHQSMGVMSAASQEYFNYGKAIFNERRNFFLSVVNKRGWNNYIEPSTFPTWDELVARFHR